MEGGNYTEALCRGDKQSGGGGRVSEATRRLTYAPR